MSQWIDKIVDLKEIPRLYEEEDGNWLLLEILETNENDIPTRIRVIASASDKDVLHEYIMENKACNGSNKCLLTLADPTKPCIIA